MKSILIFRQLFAGLRKNCKTWPCALSLLFVTVLLVYLQAHFVDWQSVSNGLDWGQFQLHAAVARSSLWRYHEFPAFNPYLCGGYPLLANPQVDMLSPWWFISMALGEQAGIRITVFGHLFIALWGMYAWSRYRLLSQTASLGAAFAFGLSGFFAAHIGWGHQNFLPFVYLPLVMLFYERARAYLPWGIGVGALVALMLYEGGVYAIPMTLLLLVLRAIVDMLREPRRAHRIVLLGLVAGAVALGLSAIKSFPTFIYLMDNPRTVRQRDSLLLSQVFEIFLGRNTDKRAPGFIYNRFEYYAYVGPVVIAALLWSLFRARDKKIREGLMFMGFIALFMIGKHGPYSPFELQLKLPFFSQLRVPSRYSILITLFLALNFGYALDALRERLASSRFRIPQVHWWPWLLIVAMAVDLMVLNREQLKHTAFTAPAPERKEQPFVWLKGGGTAQYRRVLQNQGSLGCFEGIHIPGGKPPLNDTQFAWLKQPEAGHIELGRWSPNTMQVAVKLKQAGTVIFNLNCIKGWQFEGTKSKARCEKRLLAVDLPKGEHHILARYRVPGLVPGFVLSIFTLLVLLAVMWWLRRKRSKTRDLGQKNWTPSELGRS